MMKRIFIYGLVAIQYTGEIEIPCRFVVHNRKHPTLKKGDIFLIDETTAVFAERSGNYKKVAVDDANISNLFLDQDSEDKLPLDPTVHEDKLPPPPPADDETGSVAGGITKVAKNAMNKLADMVK